MSSPLDSSSPPTQSRLERLKAFARKSPIARYTLIASAVQFFVLLVLEVAIALRHQADMSTLQTYDGTLDSTSFAKFAGQGKALTVYHVIFIMASLFQLFIVADALLSQNSIELVALNTMNFGLFIYSIMQLVQERSFATLVNNALSQLSSDAATFTEPTVLMIINTVATLVFMAAGVWLSWKLHREFGWQIYKRIGADISLRKQMMAYFFLMMLLKLDVFFYFTFSLQFLVVVVVQSDTSKSQIALHLIVSVIMIVVLIWAAVRAVRNEQPMFMYAFMVGSVGCMVYLIIKLAEVQSSSPDNQKRFDAVRKSLTFAIVMCLLLAALTLANAWVCLRNFGRGLKRHIGTVQRGDKSAADVTSADHLGAPAHDTENLAAAAAYAEKMDDVYAKSGPEAVEMGHVNHGQMPPAPPAGAALYQGDGYGVDYSNSAAPPMHGNNTQPTFDPYYTPKSTYHSGGAVRPPGPAYNNNNAPQQQPNHDGSGKRWSLD
ncbi:hypothetical protein RI367_003287 [Sorochytrium milnesiophthora]